MSCNTWEKNKQKYYALNIGYVLCLTITNILNNSFSLFYHGAFSVFILEETKSMEGNLFVICDNES